jgi:hypothetical protein
MKKTFVLWCMMVLSSMGFAQQGELEVVGKHPGGVGFVRWNDPAAFGQKKTEELTYGDVEGTPFWDDHWNPAYLVLRNNGAVKFNQVKVNLFTGQVHFMDSAGTELVAEAAQVPKLIFMKARDTTQVLARFEAFPSLYDGHKLYYYRVLSEGAKYRLMDFQQSFIKKSDYDPLQGKKESRFFLKQQFVIAEYAYLHALSALEMNAITNELESSPDDLNWLRENHNKLRNSSELAAFLDHLNKKQ